MNTNKDKRVYCYQCDKPTFYLFPDSRCADCTQHGPQDDWDDE